MLLAHLRGLLKPGYKHGARSVLAEDLILRALEAEVSVDMERSFMIAQACFSPLSGVGANKLYKDTRNGFSELHRKALMRFDSVLRKEAMSAAATFKALEASGFFAKLNEETDKLLAKMQEEGDSI